MARRKKDDDWFALFSLLFTRYSAWLCIPVAIAVFVAINIGVLIAVSMAPMLRGVAQMAPLLGGAIALVVLLAGLKAGIEKASRRNLYDSQTSIESIRALSWYEFELLIGEAYRRQGYEVVETGKGADGGIDLRLKSQVETVLVQCKQWKVYKVGVKPIRELYGILMAEQADKAIFVTSGVYTQEARAFAEGKPMILVEGDGLCRLVTRIREERATAQQTPPAGKTAEIEPASDAPVCPLCRSSMIQRTSKRGSDAGSQFWGCSTFPKCRGTRPVAKWVG